MRIPVRLFAGLAEAAGGRTVELEWRGGTASELLESLAVLHPELAGRLAACRVAVDREFIDLAARVEPPAEVALVPPVSGG